MVATNTVMSEGVALRRTPEHELQLYALTDGGVHTIGSFKSAAAAWKALDKLDAPDAAHSQAA